jgi:hypothetical protein
MYNEKERERDRLFPVSKPKKHVRVKKRWERKKRIDSTELFMHERQWFFLLYARTPYFFRIHLYWHRVYVCVYVLATMRCRVRSTNERHAYGEGERENNGAVRCSSCGTNLIPLHIFSLSLLIANTDAFLPLPDISSSSRARPTLTYWEKKGLHTHSHTHSNARSCVDPHRQKMT